MPSYSSDRHGRPTPWYDDYEDYHVYNQPANSYYRYGSGNYDTLDGRRPRRSKSQGSAYPAPVVRRATPQPQPQHQHQPTARGYDDDRRGRHHHSSYHSGSSSSSSPSHHRRSSSSFAVFGDERDRELRHVVTSAMTAGAVEAFRLRNSPGKWTGNKGGRVATAAIGAAVADTAVESNNPRGKHSRRHVVESTMAGLLTDRLLNGKRKK